MPERLPKALTCHPMGEETRRCKWCSDLSLHVHSMSTYMHAQLIQIQTSVH